MNRDRFREAKLIYGSALEREPAEREAYLRGACAGDDTLRNDVESLLGHRVEAQEFFEEELFTAPPGQAGRGSAAEPRADLTGRTLSHYAIVAKIGEGGMGVVYRARDTRLDRLVAVKVLAPEKVADPDRRRRFIQEAKAASALNHPNIITIHDIDTADGVTFIVMEYVRGKTLDQLVLGKRTQLRDVVRRGVQIADALSAAHLAGIVHRDIKPANIMLADTGLVKVLDFGLAKLDQLPDRPRCEPQTGSRPGTDDGVILGTLAYMSPEQAEGKNADPRSDIYSLGAVLYEMTTGRRAFDDATNASALAAILREEPKPAGRLAVEIPPELDRVISRCLLKDRERRFQHMSDLKVALEELEGESGSMALVAAALRGARARRAWVWGAGAFLLAVSLGGLGAWLGVSRRPASGPVATVSAFTVVPGAQVQPAVSPDGTQVAFVWNGDIHVQRVGETTPRQVTSNPAFESSPVWSPDARHLAFLRGTGSGTDVIVVPSAGGPERRLLGSMMSCGEALARQFCGPAWSPDGRVLTVVDRDSSEAPSSIFLVDIDTRERRKLTTPPPGFEDGLSAFAPDGRRLAFARRPGWPLSDIYVLPLTDAGQRSVDPIRITRDNAFIWGFDWASDGHSIVFASSRGGVDSLWRVASWGGAPEGLPVGGNDAFWPSVSRRGNRLAYSCGNASMHVWRVAAPGAERADEAPPTPMRISHTPRWDQQPAVSPDARRIAWSSTHSGSHQIWVSGSSGALPMQLTSLDPPGADGPRWSPDGRHIAFRGFSPGPEPDLFVIPAEGGAARRLTTGAFVASIPRWSRDGRWVYFGSDRDGVSIWKVPAAGGSPLLVARPGWWPVESLDRAAVYHGGLGEGIWRSPAGGGGAPVLLVRNGSPPVFESFDGTFVYYRGPDAGIWRVPAAGGAAARVLTTGKRAVWTASQTGIYVLDPDATGGPAIEFVPFAGARRDVVRLPGEPGSYVEPLSGTAAGLAASPDGRWVVYLRGEAEDMKVMLVENFR